jgi:hypothetical protein
MLRASLLTILLWLHSISLFCQNHSRRRRSSMSDDRHAAGGHSTRLRDDDFHLLQSARVQLRDRSSERGLDAF